MRYLNMLALLALAGVASAAEVVLPTTGVDMGAYVTAGITAIAAVVAVVVGGYFAFLVIRKGIRWAGKALG